MFSCKFCLWLLMGLVIGPIVRAQEKIFVYIQAEKNQPFYIKANGRLVENSGRTYVIVPRLLPGANQITVGFPKNEYPEQTFLLRLSDGRDEGYLLKNMPGNGFVLYNLQNFQVVKRMVSPSVIAAENPSVRPLPLVEQQQPDSLLPAMAAGANESSKGENLLVAHNIRNLPQAASLDTGVRTGGINKSNRFIDLLNKVVKDSRPPVSTPEIVEDTTASVGMAQTPDAKQAVVSAPGTSKKSRRRQQAAEQSSNAGNEELTGMVGVSAFPGGNAVSSQPVVLNPVPGEDTLLASHPLVSDTVTSRDVIVAKPEKRKRRRRVAEEPVFIEFLPSDSSQSIGRQALFKPGEEILPIARRSKRVRTVPVADSMPMSNTGSVYSAGQNGEAAHKDKERGTVSMINSDCGSTVATEEYQRIRRRIAVQKNEESMLNMAARYLRNKCYTSEQIQSIAYLFTSDEYKYRLLDMAYPHVFDTDHFAALEKVFNDPYFIGRFRAMVRR